jgi:hypothetical protein
MTKEGTAVGLSAISEACWELSSAVCDADKLLPPAAQCSAGGQGCRWREILKVVVLSHVESLCLGCLSERALTPSCMTCLGITHFPSLLCSHCCSFA